MKLKNIEEMPFPLAKAHKRPPAKRREKIEDHPPVKEEAEPLTASEEVEVEVKQKPTKTFEEKMFLLKRFQEKVKSQPVYYQTNHPKLWSLYQELQAFIE